MVLQAVHVWFQKFPVRDWYVTQIYPINMNRAVFEQIIIQHLYREMVKTTMKMILVAVTTIFWVSMMSKLYYGC